MDRADSGAREGAAQAFQVSGLPRVVLEYRYQRKCNEITAFSDSDWAGSRRTAMSTSGGMLMSGTHCISIWSSNQRSITHSSLEVELVAAGNAAVARRSSSKERCEDVLPVTHEILLFERELATVLEKEETTKCQKWKGRRDEREERCQK